MSVRACSIVIWLLATLPAIAVADAHLHSEHLSHTSPPAQQAPGNHRAPAEAGQSAFAAIAEIVALLEADPSTDWTQVRIDALREHLVDMDRLTLEARVRTERPAVRQIRFAVSGAGETLRAIQNMVPAHAQVVGDLTGWSIDVQSTNDGAVVTIDTPEAADIVRLQGLGFFGFMAIGAHHQSHHLQMARGQGH